jgi:hypothetical protein
VKKAARKRIPSYPVPVFRPFLRFVSTWDVFAKQKRWAYSKEETEKVFSRVKEEGARLRTEFKNRGVNFTKDILPLFVETCRRFFDRWAARKAIAEAAREARKEIKQYQFAVQILMKEAAPLKAETKALLAKQWAAFQQYDLEGMFLQTLRREEGDDKHILSSSLKKEFHKHPGWKSFEEQVYQTLRGKGVSDRQAYTLIALLYNTLIPDAFGAAYKEDAIRLRLTS